jgi:hypothetical protein
VIARLDGGPAPRAAGLLVERAATAELNDVRDQGASSAAAYPSTFGPVLLDEEGMFQLVELPRLLPPDKRRVLFSSAPDEH